MEIKRTTFKKCRSESSALSITLSDWSTVIQEAYATHAADGKGKFWGHYLDTRKEADKDYDLRVRAYQRKGYVIDSVWALDDNIEETQSQL